MKNMEPVVTSMPMAINTMASGFGVKKVVMEHSRISMVLLTMVNGRRIRHLERGICYTQMETRVMASFKKGKKKGLGSINIMRGLTMRDNGEMINDMEVEQ